MPKQPVTLPKSPVTISRNSLSVTIAEMTGHDAEIGGHDQPKYALNRYYAAAEACAVVPALVKLKYTADEVMAVFSGAGAAMQAGSEMLRAVAPVLAAHGLGAGCGVHQGLLVEGVLGGTDSKAYDFIGDTVNTAQRLCDAAGPGELLATLATCRAAGHTPREERAITAKGKREPLAVGVMAV